MKWPLHRCPAAARHRFDGSTIQRLLVGCALFFFTNVRAELSLPVAASAHSVSGQFAVISARQVSPLARRPAVLANADLVRLEPALLAVSAERIKESVWRDLGVSGRWRGQIFLALHPALSLDENVTIVTTRFGNTWNCRVELPDIVSRTRLARALTGAVLLELANRNAGAHSAEIPAWLVDGLAQQLLASGTPGMILSPPTKTENGLLANRIIAVERGVDPLAGARRVLQQQPPLTFEQLNWPTDAQLSGGDGGIYRASAQLFASKVLELNDGADRLRAMLQMLPRYYNWQTAFRAAFRADFPQPVDLEKWWALQTVSFLARDAGPAWTPAVSRDKLDAILSVPVEMRPASNSLPVHAEISLQVVVRSFDAARQAAILQTKLRDLELAQLRMAPQLAGLSDEYRRALADYLGQNKNAPPARQIKHAPVSSPKGDMDAVLKKLDELDARRRTVESAIKPEAGIP
jgi:hypothetical protein